MLTQNRLQELLEYNPELGAFYWKVARGSVPKGAEAGYINKNGYRIILIDKKQHRAHRLVYLYYGKQINGEIDHINHDRADNRLANLRDVNRLQNTRNRGLAKKNKYGISGVSIHKPTSRWVAEIGIAGKSKFLKSSKDFFEACCARKSAESKLGFHENHGA